MQLLNLLLTPWDMLLTHKLPLVKCEMSSRIKTSDWSSSPDRPTLKVLGKDGKYRLIPLCQRPWSICGGIWNCFTLAKQIMRMSICFTLNGAIFVHRCRMTTESGNTTDLCACWYRDETQGDWKGILWYLQRWYWFMPTSTEVRVRYVSHGENVIRTYLCANVAFPWMHRLVGITLKSV